jgi:hypothetical protein
VGYPRVLPFANNLLKRQTRLSRYYHEDDISVREACQNSLSGAWQKVDTDEPLGCPLGSCFQKCEEECANECLSEEMFKSFEAGGHGTHYARSMGAYVKYGTVNPQTGLACSAHAGKKVSDGSGGLVNHAEYDNWCRVVSNDHDGWLAKLPAERCGGCSVTETSRTTKTKSAKLAILNRDKFNPRAERLACQLRINKTTGNLEPNPNYDANYTDGECWFEPARCLADFEGVKKRYAKDATGTDLAACGATGLPSAHDPNTNDATCLASWEDPKLSWVKTREASPCFVSVTATKVAENLRSFVDGSEVAGGVSVPDFVKSVGNFQKLCGPIFGMRASFGKVLNWYHSDHTHHLDEEN